MSDDLYSTLTKKMAATSLSSAYTIYNDKQLQKQYDEYSDTIDDWDDKIDTYTERYVKQFSAMETALSKLNSNSSYLSSMLS
jgi:flagellar hook-associated protein 2